MEEKQYEEESLVNMDKFMEFNEELENFIKRNELKGWKSISLLLKHRYTEKGLEKGLLKGIDYQMWNFFANILGKRCQTTCVVVESSYYPGDDSEAKLRAYEFSGKVLLGHVNRIVLRNEDQMAKDEKDQKMKEGLVVEQKEEEKSEERDERDQKMKERLVVEQKEEEKSEERDERDQKMKERLVVEQKEEEKSEESVESESQDYRETQKMKLKEKERKESKPILLVLNYPETDKLRTQEGAEYTGNEGLQQINWYYCAALVIDI